MALVCTRGVLLRSFPYGETSRILRFYTEELGTVGIMARGARKRDSKGGSGLETFAGGRLTLYVKESRGLQTLKDFAADRPRRGLARSVVRFGAASVVGELVLRHGGEAAAPALFGGLEQALDRLEAVEEENVLPALLSRAWSLVVMLGYHPVTDRCVLCGAALGSDAMARMDFDAGGLRCPSCQARPGGMGPRVGPGAREQLDTLLRGQEADVTRPRAHLQLLSDFVTYHVSGTRPMDSFAFLAGLLPADEP